MNTTTYKAFVTAYVSMLFRIVPEYCLNEFYVTLKTGSLKHTLTVSIKD